MYTMCVITVFSTFLQNEYKYSRYSHTKKSILNNITIINSSTDPSTISTNFIFLPNVNISIKNQNLTDDLFDNFSFFNNIANIILINRKVSICSQSGEWIPLTRQTKYSPDESKFIYNSIQIGNFTISKDLISKVSPKKILKPPKDIIYKEFSNKKNKKFIYSYIGQGWFYHQNNGNVSKTMLQMAKFINNEYFQISINIWSLLFNTNFNFIKPKTLISNSQKISNKEQIEHLMSNCNKNDVRLRYQYYVPTKELSIIAFKDNNLLMTKNVNGYEFGGVINGAVKSPEDAISKFPLGFSEDYLDIGKISSAFLILVFTFIFGSRNRYKRDISIVIFSSIILIIRSFIWKRSYLFFISRVLLVIFSLVYLKQS